MQPKHEASQRPLGSPLVMPDNVALFATVILVLPMLYLLLAAPAFLLVKLDITPVARLLRGMFDSYFIVLAIAGAIGTTAVAMTGRWGLAIGFGLLTALALRSRRWFMDRMNFDIEREAIDADVAHRMRRLHWGGMLANAVQLAAVIACIPYISAAPS
jgi:hypothetical protein